MKRIILLSISQLILFAFVHAQNDVDALRYSTTTFGGTARSMAMAGAFGSLGADFSTLSSNPAGIGLFTKSEFTITPSFYIGKTKSTFNGTKADEIQYNFNLSNAGIVFTSQPDNGNSVFKNFQFGFGVNRINNFNNRQLMEGFNSKNSITDTYVDYANGTDASVIANDVNGVYAFDLYPAWQTYMIDTIPGSNNSYYGAVPSGSNVFQRKEINTWGSMNEMVLSFGTNVSDRLYLGATLGFPFIRYFERSTYTEMDKDESIYDFKELSQYNELTTTGSGFNIKFGMIVRANDWLRFGGAIHSPTWYNNMSDTWYAEYSTYFDNNDSYFERTPIGNYNYRLETPWRAIGSASVILLRTAIISADYEYVDYGVSRLRASDYNFYDENESIRNKYAATHNFRLGGEIKFGNYYVRGGAAYYMSPFSDNINDADRFYFTGGFGFRDQNFFLDLAFVNSQSNSDYYMYGSPNVTIDPVRNKQISNNLLLTLGFRY